MSDPENAARPGYPANPRLTVRSLYRHFQPEHVRWSDTDMLGHVNNLGIAAYCETGRSMFLRPMIGGKEIPRPLFVLTQVIVNYLDELHWPANIDVGTGVLHIGRTSCRLGQGVFGGDRCYASCEAVLVLIDDETRRPLAIAPEIRDWLAGFLLDL